MTFELCRACVSLGMAALTCLGVDKAAGDLDNEERDRRPDNRDMSVLDKECNVQCLLDG